MNRIFVDMLRNANFMLLLGEIWHTSKIFAKRIGFAITEKMHLVQETYQANGIFLSGDNKHNSSHTFCYYEFNIFPPPLWILLWWCCWYESTKNA